MSSTKKILKNYRRSEVIAAYLFLAPNALLFLAITMVPLLSTFVISTLDWDFFNPAIFVGFSNFIELVSAPRFITSLMNNLIYTLISVPLTLGLSLLVALLLNGSVKGMRFFRTVYFIPNITAYIAIALVFGALLSTELGPVNTFLRTIGVAEPPGWLSSPNLAIYTISLISVWRGVGYYAVIYLAGLQGIPVQLYEAAKIDGASALKRFWHITIPMLSPTTVFVTSIAIIWSFQVFDLVYVMTSGGPGQSTNVLVYMIILEAFVSSRFGYSAAVSVVLFFLTLVITFIQYRVLNKWVDSTF